MHSYITKAADFIETADPVLLLARRNERAPPENLG